MIIIIVRIIISTSTLVVMADPLLKGSSNDSFILVCETKSDAGGGIPVMKYVSKNTGLHVIIAKVSGPLVYGYLTVGTEAHDDDGLPHTLEHLIFLGSEGYPYKGVLDLLANRCLAKGTNAWTDVSHTAYTMETAGKEGFLNLVPIYLDHLLYPTLTDAGFLTEVYHVTGEGEDAGVVYSEMQSRENTGDSLTYRALVRSIYPEPSGYRYETGGIMANLRESVTNDKVRDYHAAMYRPENLHVIIVGQVEPKDVFAAIDPIERRIMEKEKLKFFKRPWESPVSPFIASEDIEIFYSTNNEDDTGIVRIAWRGPSLVTDVHEFQSMEVVMKYLTNLSVSPLPNIFVETDDPYASSIDGEILRNSVTALILTFEGVPTNKISSIKPLLMETLNNIMNEKMPFDSELMENVLKNLILQEVSKMETEPQDILAITIIADALFGHSSSDFNKFINKKLWLEQLISRPSSYWIDLMKKYFNGPCTVVRGIPSVEEAKRIQETEAKRIEARKKKLGEGGLKEWELKLKDAKLVNELPPPMEMLESVPTPSISSINFHQLKVYSNIKNVVPFRLPEPRPSVMNLKKVPVMMQLDDIQSNFVEVIAVLDTSSLNSTQKLYLEILMELLMESPIHAGDTTIPYEEVVKQLNADTVKAEVMNGLSMWSTAFCFEQFFTYIGIHLKMEIPKYEKGVMWLRDILFNIVFDPERVRVKANKLINSIGENKRDGNHILGIMYDNVVFKADTNANKVNIFRQENFLNELLVQMKMEPSRILTELKEVYNNITDVRKLVVHMASDLTKLATFTDLDKPWLSFAPDGKPSYNFNFYPVPDSTFLNKFDSSDPVTGYVTGLGSIESAYMYQTTKSISNYSHSDLPALMVAISYLTQLEGPMWKEIRGKGLSYHYNIYLRPNEGMITLKLARASQLIKAYKGSIAIFEQHLNYSASWDPLLFESGRSSLIFSIVSRESEVADVVQQSLLAYYRQVPHTYNRDFLNKINEVTLPDMNRVAQQYFKPLVDPRRSKTVIVCPPNKVLEVEREFNSMGHKIEIIGNLENSWFAE